MTQTFYVTVCLFFYIHQKISKVRIKKRFGKIFLSNPHEVTILNQKRKDIFMRKKQKIKKKKQSQRAYKGFISIVNWYKNKFDVISHISNIYGNEGKKEVIVYRLPLWRDITLVQKLAYFFYFMAETQPFENIKPFTLDLSKSFRNRYKKLTYKNLKAVIIKKIYGNLDYILKSSNKPMMSFILENKTKDKRKDINDKETHIHGIREVFDETTDSKIRLALKTSVCNGKKEYNEPEYRNMLQTKKKYNDDKYGAKGWLWYLNKGVCCNHGLYISQPLLEKIRNDYERLYQEYKESIQILKEKGIKIKYKKPEMS